MFGSVYMNGFFGTSLPAGYMYVFKISYPPFLKCQMVHPLVSSWPRQVGFDPRRPLRKLPSHRDGTHWSLSGRIQRSAANGTWGEGGGGEGWAEVFFIPLRL